MSRIAQKAVFWFCAGVLTSLIFIVWRDGPYSGFSGVLFGLGLGAAARVMWATAEKWPFPGP